MRRSFGFMSTGASWSSAETRLTLQVYVSVLLEIMNIYVSSLGNVRDLNACTRHEHFPPTLTIALYWVYACIH